MFGLFKDKKIEELKETIALLNKAIGAQDKVNQELRTVLDNHAKIINGLSHNQQLIIKKIEELEVKKTIKKVTKKSTKKKTKK